MCVILILPDLTSSPHQIIYMLHAYISNNMDLIYIRHMQINSVTDIYLYIYLMTFFTYSTVGLYS